MDIFSTNLYITWSELKSTPLLVTSTAMLTRPDMGLEQTMRLDVTQSAGTLKLPPKLQPVFDDGQNPDPTTVTTVPPLVQPVDGTSKVTFAAPTYRKPVRWPTDPGLKHFPSPPTQTETNPSACAGE
jgi:hypothetical protein